MIKSEKLLEEESKGDFFNRYLNPDDKMSEFEDK